MKELAIYKNKIGELVHSYEARKNSPLPTKAELGNPNAPRDYLQQHLMPECMTSPDGIKIIKINKALCRYSDVDAYYYDMLSYDAIYDAIQEGNNDSNVKAILLNFDTPGGEVNGCFELVDYIKTNTKPVYGYVSYLCASAGYALAVATKMIFAVKASYVGSIGTMTVIEDWSKLLEDYGIKTYQFVSDVSPLKNPDPGSDEGAKAYQDKVNELGNLFVDIVADGRGVKREKVLSDFGKGDIMMSARAEAAGMIDKSNMNLMEVLTYIREDLSQGSTENGSTTAMSKNIKNGLTTQENKTKKNGGTNMSLGITAQTEDPEKDKEVAEEDPNKDTTAETDKETEETAEGEDPEKDKEETAEGDEEMAEEEPPKEDEEVKAFVKKNASMCARYKAHVVASERHRQKKIDSILVSFPDQKDLIQENRYKSSMSAEQLAYTCMKADKAMIAGQRASIKKDAEPIKKITGGDKGNATSASSGHDPVLAAMTKAAQNLDRTKRKV